MFVRFTQYETVSRSSSTMILIGIRIKILWRHISGFPSLARFLTFIITFLVTEARDCNFGLSCLLLISNISYGADWENIHDISLYTNASIYNIIYTFISYLLCIQLCFFHCVLFMFAGLRLLGTLTKWWLICIPAFGFGKIVPWFMRGLSCRPRPMRYIYICLVRFKL